MSHLCALRRLFVCLQGSQKRALTTPEHPQSKRSAAILASPGLLLSPASFSPRYETTKQQQHMPTVGELLGKKFNKHLLHYIGGRKLKSLSSRLSLEVRRRHRSTASVEGRGRWWSRSGPCRAPDGPAGRPWAQVSGWSSSKGPKTPSAPATSTCSRGCATCETVTGGV